MTTMLHNLHFIRPAWLLLAPLAVALWWLWQRRSDPLRGWREQITRLCWRPWLLGASPQTLARRGYCSSRG